MAVFITGAGIPPRTGPRLPAGYKRLEYIQSTGTQWIDTNFIPQHENFRVVLDFAYSESNDGTSLFGSQKVGTSGSGAYSIIPFVRNGTLNSYVGGSAAIAGISVTNNVRYSLDAEANNGQYTVSLSGTVRTSAYTKSLNSTQTLFIFADNQSGTAGEKSKYRLYSCKFYDNGELVRNFVPCKNLSGVVGLYDYVDGLFYANAGTGAFTAGPEIGVGVDAWTELEWIQSSGTQYINTGFAPNNRSRLAAKIAHTYGVGDNICGVRNSSSDTTNRFGLITYGSANKFGAFFGTAGIQAITMDTNIHTYDLSASGFALDGTTYSVSSSNFSCSYSFLICAWSNGSSGIQAVQSIIYSFRLYDNSELIRDFVPAQSGSAIGLYDKCEGVLYTNCGSGSFTGG